MQQYIDDNSILNTTNHVESFEKFKIKYKIDFLKYRLVSFMVEKVKHQLLSYRLYGHIIYRLYRCSVYIIISNFNNSK